MYSLVFLCFDNFVYCRLRESALLSLGRLVEGGLVQLDRSVLTALVDRWRQETHTFHLPCGEMAPMLQDVAYLLSLPIVGEAVGPRVVAASWKALGVMIHQCAVCTYILIVRGVCIEHICNM